MKSWDLFDTLVAARSTKPAGDDTKNLFPIWSNVAQVKPEDIIVSDYYAPAEANRVVREVLKLENDVIVTPQDKANGAVWPGLKQMGVTHHTGDNKHSDFIMPQQFGIAATHYVWGNPVPAEKVLYSIDPILGLMSREARLTVPVNPQLVRFQELQIAVNFPFLLLATVWLERLLISNNRDTALMSSRDACLWVTLAQEMFKRRKKNLSALYFYSGRLPRVFPSESYLRYVNALLARYRSVIVDLNGTGWSLKRLAEKIPGTPIAVLSHVKVPGQEQVQEKLAPSKGWFDSFIEGNPIGFEAANYARHPMISDVDATGSPVFMNPTGFPWGTYPAINVMHETFAHMLEVSKNYYIDVIFAMDDAKLRASMQRILPVYAEWQNDFSWNHTLFAAEHDAIFRELERRKG